MEKILVTGNLGYIGAVLTEELLNHDYNVTGLDANFYASKTLIPYRFKTDFKQIKADIRDIKLEFLKGFDAIIHLAALSNDPLGKLRPELTHEINYSASLRLAKLAKKANVRRFLFSSSCSIYGQTKDGQLTEKAPMNPLTPYAKSKVDLEKGLYELASESFSPVYLRNSTAYGISPNMRFDLVLNNLMGWAFTTKEIKILSDGKAWRPIVHIRDICNAFIATLKASQDEIHNEAFNVGINAENYQVKTMAEKVHEVMKTCEIKILGQDNPDPRNYNVNFNKITKKLKHYNPKWDITKGINELYTTFKEIKLNYELFTDKNFTRLNQIKYLLEKNKINENLYWINT